MKLKKNIVIISVIGATLFIGGIACGSYYENYNHEIKVKSLNTSDRIAVVNLDEGVKYKNKEQYFANKIINKEGEDLVVTGLSDAEDGINNGKYNSYVIIPPQFSSNMTSINNNPVKTTITYKISNNLSNDAKDIAYAKVMKFKDKLNDDLGYIYIKSILSDFHKGQDNAKYVLGNDIKEKDVINAISDMDLVKAVNLREGKAVNNNIKDLNIDTDVKTNIKVLSEIRSDYSKYLGNADNDKSNIEKLSGNVVEQLAPMLDSIKSFDSLLNANSEINFNLDKTSEVVKDFNRNLNEKKDEILKLSSNNDIVKRDSFNNSISQLDKHFEIEKLESEINGIIFKQKFGNSVNVTNTFDKKLKFDLKQDLRKLAKLYNLPASEIQQFNLAKYIDLKSDINKVDNNVSSDKTKLVASLDQDKDQIKSKINVVLDNVTKSANDIKSIEISVVKKAFEDDATTFNTKQNNIKEELLNLYAKNQKLTSDELQQLKQFNIKSYVNDEQLKEMYEKYLESNSNVKEKVQNKNQEYLNYVNAVNNNFDKQLIRMRENVQEQKQASDKQVTKGLKSAKTTVNISSSNNQRLMRDLISKLKNTRKNNGENEEVYSLINHPLDDKQLTSFTNDDNTDINYLNYVFIGYLGLLGAGIITWLVFKFMKR